MNIAPEPKTNEISDALWPIFLEDERLDEISTLRYRHEIAGLKNSHPEGHLILSALLAAIKDDTAEVLRLAAIAIESVSSIGTMQNWSNLLMNAGLVEEGYAFAKKAFQADPVNLLVLSAVIPLAAVTEDIETLRDAITFFRRAHPQSQHLSFITSHFEEFINNSSEDELSDEYIAMVIGALLESDHAFKKQNKRSKRTDRITRTLLEKVEI